MRTLNNTEWGGGGGAGPNSSGAVIWIFTSYIYDFKFSKLALLVQGSSS